eukprot:1153792-Pelagomonas_calceolata.AAC.1
MFGITIFIFNAFALFSGQFMGTHSGFAFDQCTFYLSAAWMDPGKLARNATFPVLLLQWSHFVVHVIAAPACACHAWIACSCICGFLVPVIVDCLCLRTSAAVQPSSFVVINIRRFFILHVSSAAMGKWGVSVSQRGSLRLDEPRPMWIEPTGSALQSSKCNNNRHPRMIQSHRAQQASINASKHPALPQRLSLSLLPLSCFRNSILV